MELNPLKPGDAHLECVVRNGSDRAVRVPVTYSGGHEADLSLHTPRTPKLRLILWAGPEKKEHKELKPSAEVTAFKALLKDVLLLEVVKRKPLAPREQQYYWTWEA
jgi:hypothetical protein